MRTPLLVAILAFAVAGLGCTKNEPSSSAPDTDATGAAKSAEGGSCPHHKDKAAGDKAAGDTHDCAMHEGKPCDMMAGAEAHDCSKHAGKPCDMMHDGKPCDMMHDGKPCDMMGGKMHGAGPMDPAAHAAKVTEMLGLDADQTAKVQAVFTEFAPRQQAIRERMMALHQDMGKGKDTDTPDEQAMAAKKAAFTQIRADKDKLHEELTAAIDPILTAEQRVRFQEIKAEHHGKDGKSGGDEGDGGCGCGGHGDPK